jgi:hypothetical protein
MPSAALDPNDPNTVYVAFCGGASPSATDVDLFISKGTPDAQTGVLEFSTCRVTGPQLGESPSGRYDLWLPSIAVDCFGGINLLYWRTASADPTPTPVGSVKYARFESFSQISSGQHASFSAVLSALVPQNTGAVFGDYHMLVSAGCGRLYAAWVTDQSGSPQAYVNRITLGSCPNPGDFDNNGLVNLDDLNAFLSAFSVGSASADVNQDQCTNSLDAITFIDAWRNSPH